MKRSKERITRSDLKKLLALARSDMAEFFERNPSYKNYEGKEVLVALCQGAALHYIDKTNGVKDFDVWFFYPARSSNLPYRRRGVVDFGESKYGVHPEARNRGFHGRTVDVLMRSDKCFKGKAPEKEISNYLSSKKTQTSILLSQKAVIGLCPEALFGEVLWPTEH